MKKIIAVLIFITGCASATPENIGRASVALDTVPSDVACLQITVTGTESSVVSNFDTQTSPFLLTNLPVGQDTFTAKAYSNACSQVTPALQSSWSTRTPTNMVITASSTPTLTLDLVHDGYASVTVSFDAGIPSDVHGYLAEVAHRYCTALAGCCNSTNWNESACETAAGPDSPYAHSGIGNINSVALYSDVYIDARHAHNCLDSFDHYTCDAMTPFEFQSRAYECAQSIYGTLPLGSACTSSFECLGDAWCDREGTSTCIPIGGIGSPCGVDSSDYACQTHGYGLQQQACDWDVHHAVGTKTCKALLPLGAPDGYPSQCQTGLASGGVCVSQYPGVLPSTCAAFAE